MTLGDQVIDMGLARPYNRPHMLIPGPIPGSTSRRAFLGALVLIAVLLALFWLVRPSPGGGSLGPADQASLLRPLPTRDPLIPTPLPAYRLTATPRPLTRPTVAADAPLPVSTSPPAIAMPTKASPSQSPTTDASVSPALIATPANLAALADPTARRARIGIAVPVGVISDYDWNRGLPGWFLNWHVLSQPPRPGGIPFAQMVRINADRYFPDLNAIASAAMTNPGSLWLIGNEPDVPWQDNATPEQYAASYGVIYKTIKWADATAQVAIGGVSQPTPLRLAYLDRIRAAYQARYGEEMPVDIWNVHAFILREERDSWGVGIPPGMAVDKGTLYEIADHADMAVFRRQITEFRRWMAERGLRDKPLIVTEYSILMPESYGFPSDRVAQFMTDTFDYFLTARDSQTGYPPDDNRLVQAFCWYSAADTMYPTSNLFDPETKSLTPLGQVFREYVSRLK